MMPLIAVMRAFGSQITYTARLLLNHPGLMQASLTDLNELQREQSRTLAMTSVLFAILGINSSVLVLADFWPTISTTGCVLCLSIIGLYAIWLLLGALRSGSNHLPFMHQSIALLIVLSICWGCLINDVAIGATEQQRTSVVAMIMALVSVPLLSAPFSAAMAFWIPIAITTTYAMTVQLQPLDTYVLLCFLGYIVAMFCGIVLANKTTLERSIGRIRMQQQHDTIGLLLREYEENTADWLWETDEQLRLRRVSPRMAQQLGIHAADLEGRLLHEAIFAGDARKKFATQLEHRAAFHSLEVESEVGGAVRYLSLTGRPMIDGRARFLGYRGFGSDITEVRLAERRVQYMASFDSLTGLANRQSFVTALTEACEHTDPNEKGFAPFSVLLLDLDRFKDVNDTFGHGTGDELLAAVAKRITSAIRGVDLAARLGGDEFAILLRSGNIDDAIEIAERLIGSLSTRFHLSETVVTIGSSFGIVSFPKDGSNPADLLKNVDLALYEAKGRERGTYQLFDQRMSEVFYDQLALQADLRLAVHSEQLYVEYQPIYDLRTREIVSAEALVRWRHPVRGQISPAVFIPLAEEAGLIVTLGAFVMREACSAAALWDKSIRVAVNLSPIQFGHPDLLNAIRQTLEDTGLEPTRLEIEVTESTWLAATKQTLGQLEALEVAGIRMVLDDFGTGYSSLSCLREFHFHGLKIDGSFIRSMDGDAKAASIIRTIANLAADIGVSLTAEGIETPEQADLLRSFGIQRGQGFLLGRPRSRRAAEVSFARKTNVVGLHFDLQETERY